MSAAGIRETVLKEIQAARNGLELDISSLVLRFEETYHVRVGKIYYGPIGTNGAPVPGTQSSILIEVQI
jgi:hypothetical protein